jgi:hypothetical protein
MFKRLLATVSNVRSLDNVSRNTEITAICHQLFEYHFVNIKEYTFNPSRSYFAGYSAPNSVSSDYTVPNGRMKDLEQDGCGLKYDAGIRLEKLWKIKNTVVRIGDVSQEIGTETLPNTSLKFWCH